jgi:hypothetical protein
MAVCFWLDADMPSFSNDARVSTQRGHLKNVRAHAIGQACIRPF